MGTKQIAKKSETWQGVKQTLQHELSGNVNYGVYELRSAIQWQNDMIQTVSALFWNIHTDLQ